MQTSRSSGAVPPRDTDSKKLKRIATMAGAYGQRNYTIRDIRELKGHRTLVETLAFTPEEAAAAEEAGIDTLKVRYDPKYPELAAEIRRAAPHTFMSFSLPLVAVTSPEEALRLAFSAMEIGGDAIMCQWSPRFISALAEAGVPAQGHVGLVPRRSTWTGGLRAVGKTADEALQLYREMKALENAGAWAVEVEVIPDQILRELSKRTTLITSSIGAGSGGDIQFLFGEDILGDGPGPFPRHSKQYRNLYAMRQQMQRERVTAFKEYIADVQSNIFPATEHIIEVKPVVVSEFLEKLDKEPR
ncbi:PanB Ketopantoate hydroxymethyltransferase [Oxalobacteraceae bacterium]